MTTTTTPPTTAAAASPGSPAAPPETLAELHRRLGGVPLERIRCQPPPGTATEDDVLRRVNGEKHLFELVDGVLVEKAMGYYESVLAVVLIQLLSNFLEQHDLGVVSGADGTLRLMPGLVRIPDVAFIAWERFPNRRLPAEPIPGIAPDLAVEVLSEGNTDAEMERKLGEYFATGVRLVWYLDPKSRTARVYTSPTTVQVLTEADTLEGEPVLPGFRLPLREWFERAERGRGRD
jgi:Uma2 family endonuclease